MERLRKLGSIFALLGVEVGAIVLLHRLGNTAGLGIPQSGTVDWFKTAPFEDIVGGSVRLLALGIAYWLLLSTAFYSAARASRIPGAIRAAEWVTLPALRRTLDRALVVGVATSSVVGGSMRMAVAQTSNPPETDPIVMLLPGSPTQSVPTTPSTAASTTAAPTTVSTPGTSTSTTKAPSTGERFDKAVDDLLGNVRSAVSGTNTTTAPTPGVDETLVTTSTTEAPPAPAPTTSTTATTPGQGLVPTPATSTPTTTSADPADETPAREEEAPPADEVLGEQTYQVAAGDNLWSIAEAQTRANGATPSEDEIRTYWIQLVETNRNTLRSGNPDLIYPGEVITLPAR